MPQTNIRGSQILNSTVQRQDLDVSTVGQAVVTKLVQGSGITLSSTGADSGTGDVTVTASGDPPVSTPVVLGETAADAFFTGGIIVPRYKNHPDGIWTYGAFDDHFDAGSINAKWVQTLTSGILNPVTTQGGSELCLGGTSPAANATPYQNIVTQQLPVGATHQISLKLNFLAFPLYISGQNTFSYFVSQLEYAAGSGVQIILRRYFFYSNNNSVDAMVLNFGASFGTAGPIFIAAIHPAYLRLTYDSSKNTTISVSTDGVTWMIMATITGTQSGFSTTNPLQWTMGIQSFWQSPAFAQIDWIKHV